MTSKGYQWVQQHDGANVSYELPEGTTLAQALDDTRGMADSAAKLGHDAFYRLFGPEGFVIAFSVLGGMVKHWTEPTFPAAHWRKD